MSHNMSYFIAIKWALFLFLFLCPFLLFFYRKKKKNILSLLLTSSFLFYLLAIYFLVIFPLPDKNTIDPNQNRVNLVPFQFLFTILKEPCVYTVLLNVLMFVPFGMYLRYFFSFSYKRIVFLSFCLSLFFEMTQITGLYFLYPYPYRVFDVDDLFLNTIGGLLGSFLLERVKCRKGLEKKRKLL